MDEVNLAGSSWQTKLKAAAAHLTKNDAILAPVIKKVGLPDFAPHTNYYGVLVDSIISQQLSVKAASAIEGRFKALFSSQDFPAAELILSKDVEQLRAVGLSRPKVTYIRDLAQNIVDGQLKFDDFNSLSNEQISNELTAVKGIGQWTADMFLMFCMGRLDVLPTGDLGIRNGVKALYGFSESITPQQVSDIAAKRHWQPYQSVASWYIWQSLGNKPAI